MDANEIITNEEVIEVTEEITDACFDKGVKVTAGIGLAVLVGGLAYKFIVKPAVAKLKAKREEQEEEAEDYIEVFDDNEEEEPKEETEDTEND